MKKLIIIAIALISLSQDILATNYTKINNSTDASIKVGLFKSLFNFVEMRVEPGMNREYDSGQEDGCLSKVTVNGSQIWSGKNCDNYEITVTKQAEDKFEITFKPSAMPKPKAASNTNNDISF